MQTGLKKSGQKMCNRCVYVLDKLKNLLGSFFYARFVVLVMLLVEGV